MGTMDNLTLSAPPENETKLLYTTSNIHNSTLQLWGGKTHDHN